MLKMFRKLLKGGKKNRTEEDSSRQILKDLHPRECCWWVFDKKNKCYHTQCGHDYSFSTNGRGGFCMYCGRVNVVSNVEEINEWLGISN